MRNFRKTGRMRTLAGEYANVAAPFVAERQWSQLLGYEGSQCFLAGKRLKFLSIESRPIGQPLE